MNQQDFKNQYPDLIAPIVACPEGIPVETCPLIPYWYKQRIHERIDLFSELSAEKIEEIRLFHENCLKNKLEESKRRKNPEKV